MSEDNRGVRQVLNAHIGKTNMIDQRQIETILSKTFETIKNVLMDHCGPYGKYAMLTDPTNPVAQPTFTKDGINIVRSLEFISPMERYVKECVAYIGSRVERSAGDGTTSSMIIMTVVLEALRAFVSSNRISYGEFTKLYKRFEEQICEELEKEAIKVTEDTPKDIIKKIVFHQSCTSSHGDLELSEMIAELYSSMPPRAWDYVTYQRRSHETKERLMLEKDSSDYTARAGIYDNNMYNTMHGDGFEIENAELVVVSEQFLTTGRSYQAVVKILKDTIADKNARLVICIPASTDVATRVQVSELLVPVYPQKRIAIFQLDTVNPQINDLSCLMAVCGHDFPYDENHGILCLSGVNVSFKDYVLKLSGILEDPKNKDDNTNPDALKDDSPVSKKLRFIDEILENIATSTRHTANTQKEVSTYKRLYNQLLMRETYTLVIGGSAYDNEAAVDVVQDALKASREALRSGVVLGGYATLKKVLHDRINSVAHSTVTGSAVRELEDAFNAGIDLVTECVLKHSPEPEKHPDIHDMLNAGGKVYDVTTNTISTIQDITESDNPVIVQPLAVDKALITRFGEVALKFLFTNRIIIPGGVFVDEQE